MWDQHQSSFCWFKEKIWVRFRDWFDLLFEDCHRDLISWREMKFELQVVSNETSAILNKIFQLYRFKIIFVGFSITGDCKDGIHCKSTFSPHFRRYSHAVLATTRSCGIFENTNKEKTNESVSQFYLQFYFLYFLCSFHHSLIIFFPCALFSFLCL